MSEINNLQSPLSKFQGQQGGSPPVPPMPLLSGRWWSDRRRLIALFILVLVLVGILLSRAADFLKGAGPVPATFDTVWQFVAVLCLLIVTGTILYTLVDIVAPGGYSASLLMTAMFLPITAAAGTVVAYLARMQPEQAWNRWISDLAVLVGLLVALALWPLFALFYQPFATVDRANARVYDQLRARTVGIGAALTSLADHERCRQYHVALKHREFVCRRLAERDLPHGAGKGATDHLRWAFATGYLDLWERIHRAEEALIDLLPVEDVIGGALHDELRLVDSNIPQRAQLQDRLRLAVSRLRSASAAYLLEQSRVREGVAGISQVAIAVPCTATAPAAGQDEIDAIERQARTVLRHVTYAINEHRESRWDGLVRARNQMVATMIVVGATTYALLGLAVLQSVPPEIIAAATAYYLVGAVTGLFSRLRAASGSIAAIEDYHLSVVRLLSRPLLSGLAALGGIVLTGMFTASIGGVSLAPDTATSDTLVGLADVFDLTKFRLGLVVAALFGLTPELLFSRLTTLTEQYKGDLKSSEVAGAGRTTSVS